MSRLAPLFALAALVLSILYVEFRGGPTAPAPPAPAGPGLEEIAVLAERLAGLERKVDALGAKAGAAVAPAARPPPAVMEEPAGRPDSRPGIAAERAEAVDALLARLKVERLSEADVDRLWELLPGSGREEAAITALREYAAAHAGDADAWYGLGAALTSKLIGGQVSFLEQGSLSTQAEKAFTMALAADEGHFGARYSRAVSWTFWPEGFGKGADAIRDFEVLRERHRGDASVGAMEDVYLKLAVQYRKSGDPKKAEEALREGLQTFPDSSTLKKQLEASGGK
ncbi:MAG: tetratricopeptide repeat protein [Planctomycetes bacterium]|jgi:tetratricopeptide (TPR) repeat protein|nr:tetratricopeptide repeat protein [Planctomycetota bacterium]